MGRAKREFVPDEFGSSRQSSNMVNVGIIGHGSCWETEFQPILKKLKNRIRVRAIYDTVAARAVQTAEQLRAECVEGMTALAGRADVQGILILDSSWHGLGSLRAVSRLKKPVFVASSLANEEGRLRELHEAAVADGNTLMPVFEDRYTPATIRLQELLATKLGKAAQIRIECSAATPIESALTNENVRTAFVRWMDWIRHVLRTSPNEVEASLTSTVGEEVTDTLSVRMFFPTRPNQATKSAQIRLCSSSHEHTGAHVEAACLLEQCVKCESGSAVVRTPTKLAWSNGQADAKEISESLSNERMAMEVMLDHFCRRVAGGLIPVPDLNDICKSLKVLKAAEASLRTGQRTPVERVC